MDWILVYAQIVTRLVKLNVELERHVPQDYLPLADCPLRLDHYALSGLMAGFPADGWDCEYCGEIFFPDCAKCAGDDW